LYKSLSAHGLVVKGHRQKNFQGGRGQRKKRPKNSKRKPKIAVLSLYLYYRLYLSHVMKIQGWGRGGGDTASLHLAVDTHEWLERQPRSRSILDLWT